MNQKNNYRTCIGGIILLVLSIIGLLSGLGTNISSAVQILQYPNVSNIISVITSIGITLISSGVVIAFSLLLTLKKRNKTLALVALGGGALIGLIRLINGLLNLISIISTNPALTFFSLLNTLSGLAFAATFAAAGFLCSKVIKDPGSVGKMKLLPCIAYLAYILLSVLATIAMNVAYVSMGIPVSALLMTTITSVFSTLFGNVLNLVCWYLICGWIVDPTEKKPTPKQPAQQPPQGYYPPQQPTYQAPQQNQAPQQPNYQPPQYR